MITQEYLKECLHYNPETGIFTWLERPREHFKTANAHSVFNSRQSGKTANCTHHKGYTVLGLQGKQYQAHRIAFLYMLGEFPKEAVDHINHIGTDNRWCNIRLATLAENQRNRTLNKNNKSGCTGVYWDSRNKRWRARAKLFGKLQDIGSFHILAEAIAARKTFDTQHFHPNHGKVL